MVTNDKENAGMLNRFFSNAVKNLRIPNFSDTEPLADNISHSTLKIIMKYRNYPSIPAIKINKLINKLKFKIKLVEKRLSFLEYLKRILLRK